MFWKKKDRSFLSVRMQTADNKHVSNDARSTLNRIWLRLNSNTEIHFWFCNIFRLLHSQYYFVLDSIAQCENFLRFPQSSQIEIWDAA